MTPPPKLSVVIPAWNAAGVVGTAIDSAWASGACEIIVVDDGSTDATGEVARSRGVRVVTQDNKGAAAARREGMQHVSGSVVCLLDSDDALSPPGVRSVMRNLPGDDWSVVGGVAQLRLRDGRPGRILKHPYLELSPAGLIRLGCSPWPPSAAIWRVEALQRSELLAPPPLHPRMAEDYELLIRVAMWGQAHDSPAVTCFYTPFGGKSDKHALLSVAAAEQIRDHYARCLGVDYQPRGVRQRHSAALLRRHKAESARGRPLTSAAILMAALTTDPTGVGIALWRRVRGDVWRFVHHGGV
jgi:hypothetical protein